MDFKDYIKHTSDCDTHFGHDCSCGKDRMIRQIEETNRVLQTVTNAAHEYMIAVMGRKDFHIRRQAQENLDHFVTVAENHIRIIKNAN